MAGTASNNFFDYPVDDAVTGGDAEHRFLADATEADWAMVIAHCERRRFKTGEVVIAIGEDARTLLLVRSGSFRVTAPTRRSRLETVGFVPAGSVFGEISFLDGRAATSSVVANEASEVLLLDRHSFDRLSASHPRLALRIVEDLGAILATRFRTLTASGSPATRKRR